MRASLLTRLRRLEPFSSGPCLACSGRPYLSIRGTQQVPVCEVCGQTLPAVRLIRDRNFFRNAHRLGHEANDEED
jgi:hypothetical protein